MNSKLFPVIYSLTVKKQLQTWQIEVLNDSFRTHEGIDGGTITTSLWTACSPKNKGKKNETTPQEQALKEAQAKHQKKLDAGYFEDKERALAGDTRFFEPQLAEKWKEYKDEVVYPCIVERKYDGAACLVGINIGMQTRGGKQFASSPHIYKLLEPILKDYPSIVFHGELYNHEFKSNFNKIMSLVKKLKPTEQDIQESDRLVQYHIYDCLDSSQPNLTTVERKALIQKLINTYLWKNKAIRYAKFEYANNAQEVDNFAIAFVNEGYEGAMIRNPKGPYKQSRTKDLLKYKFFEEDEFEIVDVLEGKGNCAGIATDIVAKTKNGIEFGAGVIGDREYARSLLLNKANVIGLKGTIVFQNYTPDGKPRIAKLKIIDRESFEGKL
jgi:ATP-dependent DNA ligase